jgi:SAM-dependent methyltransferase
VQVRELTLPAQEDADYSSVIALNVLEHQADDEGTLRSLHRLVEPGGAAVVMVPACGVAMSWFDHQIGHLRRYGRGELVRLAERSGWHVESVHFFNSLGLVAWVVAVRMLGMTPEPGVLLDAWDTAAIPVLRMLEQRFPPLLGKELFLVARH